MRPVFGMNGLKASNFKEVRIRRRFTTRNLSQPPPYVWQTEQERWLFCKIIYQAALDLKSVEAFAINSSATPGGYLHARAFFNSSDEKTPLSFRWLCNILELDPDYIRQGVFNASVIQQEL